MGADLVMIQKQKQKLSHQRLMASTYFRKARFLICDLYKLAEELL